MQEQPLYCLADELARTAQNIVSPPPWLSPAAILPSLLWRPLDRLVYPAVQGEKKKTMVRQARPFAIASSTLLHCHVSVMTSPGIF